MPRNSDYTRDHYAELGVPATATQADIRRAYRKRVREIHPDVRSDKADAHDAFIRLQESYAILSDERERHHYDTHRNTPPRPAPPEPPLQRPSEREWLDQAERDLARRNLTTAHKALAEVLRQHPENPRALLMLARVFQTAGRSQDRLTVLHYGVEHNPSDAPLRIELNKALHESANVKPIRKSRRYKAQKKPWLATAGILLAVPFFLVRATSSGPPAHVLQSLLGSVPAGAVLAALALSAWLAFIAASSGFIPQLDDLLLYEDTRACAIFSPRPHMPAPNVVMVPMAMLNYLMAVAWFVGAWVARGSASIALVGAFLIAPLLAVTVALFHPAEFSRILFWLPGWNLTAGFIGWFLGDFFRT